MISQNDILHLCEKTVAIVGLGRSGLAAAKLVKQVGGSALLCDDNNFELANHKIDAEVLIKADLIVLSPGVPRSHTAIQTAINACKPIINEIELAATFLPHCKFVGITGTNGKSTTTALFGDILHVFNKNIFIGGNLGIPLCEAIVQGQKPELVALELSSYQLETISTLKLEVTTLTNLAPDHLDRYASVRDYYESKLKIFDLLASNGTAVLNKLDKISQSYAFAKCQSQNLNIKTLGEKLSFLIPTSLLGAHNKQNVACAVITAKALGIPDTAIEQGLSDFNGIEHRLEIVCKKNGTTFINDSKATNVAASVTALQALNQATHLIVGGLGKNKDYTPLVEAAKKNVKTVYTIGAEGPKLALAFERTCKTVACDKLEIALEQAKKNAKQGEIILLSPACPSLDQFENFAKRGERFKVLI